MRGGLAIAALLAVLAPACWGQMRVGGRVGSFGARPGFAPHSAVFFSGGFGFGHNPRFGVFFNRNPFFFGHRLFFFTNSFFSSPIYYPAYGGYPYPVVIQTAPPSTYYPDEYYERGDLRRDLDVLTGKVDRLQQDLGTRLPPPRSYARPQPQPEPATPTVLVFKDHSTREVQNYAIVGGTLWVFSEQRAEKLPLSSLDVEATTKLNDERGVEFHLPN